jgi:hypothetical protein
MIIKYQIVAANVFPDQNYEIEINLYILHEHIQGVSHPFLYFKWKWEVLTFLSDWA